MKLPTPSALEEIVRAADCPEDVFGTEFPGMTAIAQMVRTLERAAASTRYAAGRQVMLSVAADKIRAYAEWAKIAHATLFYGQRRRYQFEAYLTVTKRGMLQYFRGSREHLESVVYLGELSALIFQGYWAHDTVEVVDGEKVVATYHVRHVGGHTDQNYFFLDDAGSPFGDKIQASRFTPGTVLRVRSVMFTSFNRFLNAAW